MEMNCFAYPHFMERRGSARRRPAMAGTSPSKWPSDRAWSGALIVPLLVLAAAPAFPQVANEYRQFLGIDTRKLIWFLAQAQKLDPGQYKGSRDALLYHCRGGIDRGRVQKGRKNITGTADTAVLLVVLGAALAAPVAAGQGPGPKVKVLATPVDASKAGHGVPVGRASAGGMLIQFGLERAKGM